MRTQGQRSLRERAFYLTLFLLLGAISYGVLGAIDPPAIAVDDLASISAEHRVAEGGISMTITGASILPGPPPRPVVTFTLTTDTGSPIPLSSNNSNPLLYFTIARLDEVTETASGVSTTFTKYFNYVTATLPGQATSSTDPFDKGGTFTVVDAGKGVYQYTFGTSLPSDFNPNFTHTVGGSARWESASQIFVVNSTLNFVPSGAPVTTVRELAATEQCNQCHDPIGSTFHGRFRVREFKLCILCHTDQLVSPEGNSVEMRVVIHKIHRAAELPSVEAGVPYVLYGDDFSEIEFPQNIRNCAKCHGEAFPYEVLPNKAACTSCHEDVNPNTGENHRPGAYADAECLLCHEPEGREFGISLTGAHTIPQLSAQAPGINFEIVSVRDAEDGGEIVHPGHHAQVTFNIKNNAGTPIDPSTMNFLRLTLAGPTTDYTTQDYNGDGVKTPGEPIRGAPFTSPGEDYLQQDARSATPVGDGNYSLTFSLPVPQDATGTYAVGIEGYKCATINRLDQHKGGLNCTSGNTLFNEIRGAGFNVVSYFSVTDPEPVPRRQIVDNTTKCAACHNAFSKNFLIHGGIRNNLAEYCAFCHNPSHDSLGRQPAPAVGQTDTTFPVHFKVMIHKIHTGHDLENPYLIFVPSGASTNVQEFHFPGDRRNCEKCHLSGTNLLRSNMGPATVTHERDSNKVVLNTFYTPPIKAACTACHDGDSEVLAMPVSTHADMQTMNPNTPEAVEECAQCHGEGEILAVSWVHQRWERGVGSH